MLRRILFVAALVAPGVLAPRAATAWNFDWAGHVEVDAEALQSDDAVKRHDAVGDLGKYDISLTERHLMRALRDPDEKVRVAAAKALGSGGSLAAVPTMIDWLNDVDPKIQQVAAAALGDIGGTDAAAALTRSLSAVDDAVRQQVVKALGAIGRRGNPNVVIALIPRLEDGKADVRIATINQLEELGDRRAVIPLVARFGDTALEARKAAVRAIGRLGDRAAVPALIRLLNDPHEDVRSGAVIALGTLGAIDALDALGDQLAKASSSNEAFRTKVAYALGQIASIPSSGKAGEDAMNTLVAQLAQPQYRLAAKEALRVAGKAAVPALVASLQGRIAGEPATAVELLRDSADQRATAVLTAELERGRVPVPNVLRALGATGDPAALVPVLRALASKDPAIRLEAMSSLRPLIAADARAGDVLVEHLADEDLEIRVLAAEYLGILRIGAAVGKLSALAGPGNPARLRLAAIDALGEIGKPEGTRALVAVLREGPAELHKPAATALAYIADAGAVDALVAQARSDRGPTRHEVVRALGATMRGANPSGKARTVLRELAQDSSVKVSLAAIAGLAAAKDTADAAFLRGLVEQASSDRRRAAAWALGELRDPGAVDTLTTAMSSRDDRLVGDAAWALGEILAANPKARTSTVVDRWLHAGKQGGWAAATNAAGGLARLLWALPREARSELLGGDRRKAFDGLAFHKSRLVRINVAHALGSLAGDAGAQKLLVQLLERDGSLQVRTAAARGLARLGGPAATAALKSAASNDADAALRELAGSLQTTVPALPARTEWRNYYVVDPGADDAPVRQEPYFVHTGDGLVWAAYTDARGELATEHAPPGDARVIAASREAEY